jgi:hypothetical protein
VYLTNIHWKASASFGLHVERVPVAYHRTGNKADLLKRLADHLEK